MVEERRNGLVLLLEFSVVGKGKTDVIFCIQNFYSFSLVRTASIVCVNSTHFQNQYNEKMIEKKLNLPFRALLVLGLEHVHGLEPDEV